MRPLPARVLQPHDQPDSLHVLSRRLVREHNRADVLLLLCTGILQPVRQPDGVHTLQLWVLLRRGPDVLHTLRTGLLQPQHWSVELLFLRSRILLRAGPVLLLPLRAGNLLATERDRVHTLLGRHVQPNNQPEIGRAHV